MDYTHRDPHCHEPGEWEPVQLYCPHCGTRLKTEQTKVTDCGGFRVRWRYKKCVKCPFRKQTKELLKKD